jgi:hypothetical protein
MGDIDWAHLDKVRKKLGALVNEAMNLTVPKKIREFQD